MIMRFGKSKKTVRNVRHFGKQLSIELLEDKRLLAIVWTNQFETGVNNPLNPLFNTYGTNEAVARQLVNRAIGDWNKVILDQNWDNDNIPSTNGTYSLRVSPRN